MTVKVSPKYQVVIPEEVRRSLNIKPGMRISVIAKGGVAFLVPVRSTKEIQEKHAGKFEPADLSGLREKSDREV
jgi:AbrB family looped-hinge helix DNA binding protein